MIKDVKKPISPKRKSVLFSIERIDLVNKIIDIPHNFGKEDDFKYSFETSINLISDKSIIQFILNYKFYETERLILAMEIENDFKVDNYQDVVKNNQIVNEDVLLFLIRIVIDHARGVQSVITKNTPIEFMYIPPLDKHIILENLSYR